MNFESFLDKQEGIYDKFRNNDVSEEGIVPSDQVQGLGGYLVALRHSSEFMKRVGEFSSRISSLVPGIAYDERNVHTTISDYMVRKEFDFEPIVLEGLVDSVEAMGPMESPTILYDEWLYNGSGVIVAGKPDEKFLKIAEKLRAEAENNGFELRLPWGAHITANRFTKRRGSGELHDFFDLMRKAPNLGESKPEEIVVCTYFLDLSGIRLENQYSVFMS